jgi:hypothetical protein
LVVEKYVSIRKRLAQWEKNTDRLTASRRPAKRAPVQFPPIDLQFIKHARRRRKPGDIRPDISKYPFA